MKLTPHSVITYIRKNPKYIHICVLVEVKQVVVEGKEKNKNTNK